MDILYYCKFKHKHKETHTKKTNRNHYKKQKKKTFKSRMKKVCVIFLIVLSLGKYICSAVSKYMSISTFHWTKRKKRKSNTKDKLYSILMKMLHYSTLPLPFSLCFLCCILLSSFCSFFKWNNSCAKYFYVNDIYELWLSIFQILFVPKDIEEGNLFIRFGKIF